VLDFHVDLADIFADDTQADELDTGDEADDADRGSPAGNGIAAEVGDDGPDNPDEGDHGHKDAQGRDQLQGLYGQAGDAVDGKGDHLAQGSADFLGDYDAAQFIKTLMITMKKKPVFKPFSEYGQMSKMSPIYWIGDFLWDRVVVLPPTRSIYNSCQNVRLMVVFNLLFHYNIIGL